MTPQSRTAASMTGVERTPTTPLDILRSAVFWIDAAWPDGPTPPDGS